MHEIVEEEDKRVFLTENEYSQYKSKIVQVWEIIEDHLNHSE